eukprot:762408-Hanusia_phi.AAC.1
MKEQSKLEERNVLLLSDFELDIDDCQSLEAIFEGLHNVSNMQEVADEIAATVSHAKRLGKDPAEVLADYHMVFVGPPGTGKTTVANRMGKLLKQLDVLPSSQVIVTSGSSLQGRYVGETKDIVRKTMTRARGGVLFIDEAYILCGSHHSGEAVYSSSYAVEAVDALVSLMTEDEYKGNLLVIMAGYEKEMEEMFRKVNPGFRSRFAKRWVNFDPWTKEQAASATVKEIERAGGRITLHAEQLLLEKYDKLSKMDGWASARDVMEVIGKVLVAVSSALLGLFKHNAIRMKHLDLDAVLTFTPEDVERTFEEVFFQRQKQPSRRKDKSYQNPAGNTDGGAWSNGRDHKKVHFSNHDHVPPRAAPEQNDDQPPARNDPPTGPQSQVKSLIKKNIRKSVKNVKEVRQDGSMDPADLMALLEQACSDLGYTFEELEKMLATGVADRIVEYVASKGNFEDKDKVRGELENQRYPFLIRVRKILAQKEEEKTAEEAKNQEKLKMMGRCPMDFEWLKRTVNETVNPRAIVLFSALQPHPLTPLGPDK